MCYDLLTLSVQNKALIRLSVKFKYFSFEDLSTMGKHYCDDNLDKFCHKSNCAFFYSPSSRGEIFVNQNTETCKTVFNDKNSHSNPGMWVGPMSSSGRGLHATVSIAIEFIKFWTIES